MSADNDTSDEAFEKWDDTQNELVGTYVYGKAAWQECRRRCEAQMEERERRAFEAGFAAHGFCLADPMGFSMEDGYRAFKEAKK